MVTTQSKLLSKPLFAKPLFAKPLLATTLSGAFLLLCSSIAQASFIFTGQSIDVDYVGSDFAIATDTITAGDNDPDIAYGDSTHIGSGLMLDDESIDFDDTSITFNIRGDGPTYSPGYQTTGLLGSYVLSIESLAFSIDSLVIGSAVNVTDLDLTDITWDSKHIYFDLSDFGIGQIAGDADLATVRLDVTLVPVPAALPLFLSGIAGLALLRRRRVS